MRLILQGYCTCSHTWGDRLNPYPPQIGLMTWLVLRCPCSYCYNSGEVTHHARRELGHMSRQTKITTAYLGIQLGLPSLVLGGFFGIYAVVSHVPGSPLDWTGILSCLAMLAFPFLIGTAAYYATLWHQNFMAGLVAGLLIGTGEGVSVGLTGWIAEVVTGQFKLDVGAVTGLLFLLVLCSATGAGLGAGFGALGAGVGLERVKREARVQSTNQGGAV
jgi:hypothetical protein